MRIGQRGANGQPGGRSTSDGGLPSIGVERLALARIGPRHRSEQPERVRHPRPVEDVVDRADLDEPARVHHGDAVGDARDRRRDRA